MTDADSSVVTIPPETQNFVAHAESPAISADAEDSNLSATQRPSQTVTTTSDHTERSNGEDRSSEQNQPESVVVFHTNNRNDDIKQPIPKANSFRKSPSAMLIAPTTILTEVTSTTSNERKIGRPEGLSDTLESSSSAARIAISLDARRSSANAPALQTVLTAIENDARQCAAELVKVLKNTRDHVKNATTISLDYMKTMNQNAQNVHSAVDVAVDQASSFIHQVAELEKELSCLDELQANLNLTKEYLTGLEQYVQSL